MRAAVGWIAIIGFVALGGCEVKGDSEQIRPTLSEAGRETEAPPIDNEVAKKFRDLAPADWKLRRVTDASAQFDVTIVGTSESKPVSAIGAILLDGRFERYLSPLDFGPKVLARAHKEFDAVAESYPYVDGYERVVDSRPLAFDSRRNIEARSIKYLDHERGIYCLGTNPGTLRCLWGDPNIRFVLFSHTDDTVAALEYVSSIQARETKELKLSGPRD